MYLNFIKDGELDKPYDIISLIGSVLIFIIPLAMFKFLNNSSKRRILVCMFETSRGCSKCRTALYCSRACQLKHWPVHKNICQDSNDTENSDEKLHMKAMNHSYQGNSKHIYIKGLS